MQSITASSFGFHSTTCIKFLVDFKSFSQLSSAQYTSISILWATKINKEKRRGVSFKGTSKEQSDQ